MVTVEELLEKGKKVVKGMKEKPKVGKVKERYNIDALFEIAKRTLKDGAAYEYPHKEFAEVIGFEPTAKMKRSIKDSEGKVIRKEETVYNVSIPVELRNFIESRKIEGFNDTVRIKMDRSGHIVVEPYKEYKKRVGKLRGGRKKK
jgi:hypothetical protein